MYRNIVAFGLYSIGLSKLGSSKKACMVTGLSSDWHTVVDDMVYKYRG